MSLLAQRNFSGGWNPSADQINGPENVLYRMDNCVLDELGVVALRAGSSKINSSALATTDLRSIYTAIVSGTRTRLAQGAGSVYAASGSGAYASIDSGFDTSLDIQFSSFLGQIFYASGTLKKKYDGTTVRTWGLAAPAAVPTVALVAASTNVLLSGDTTETTWTTEEGTGSFDTGNKLVGDASRKVISDTATYRGTSTRTLASATDFTTYGGGINAADEDIIQLYVRIDDPAKVEYVALMIDVNDGTFNTDYFYYIWRNETVDVSLSDEELLSRDYSVEGYKRRDVVDRIEDRTRFVATFRPDINGWNTLSVQRGQFNFVHSTDAKWWDTVKAIRVAFAGNGNGTCWFDDIKFIGGSTKPLRGNYVYRSVNVREGTSYTAKSAPSGASAETIFKNEGATVTCTNPTDTQATHIWLFRMGGTLDRFYRVARQAVTAYSGTLAITDSLSDKDALILNISLQTDNAVPPDSIVGISEDYYDRIFCLSSDGNLYPSRKLNPDSFPTGQTINIFGATETAYWIKKAAGGLYIGTSKDIYRISGTGAENPDGTVDFVKQPLNINSPPISSALAWDGNVLIYLASDGPRLFTGESSSLLRGDTDLLWRGNTRYEVSPVNTATGRFRMAIANGLLEIILPEGTSTTTSAVIWKYNLAQQRWYRHTYASQQWRSLFREPDGTLLAGDNAGFVWKLEDATATGDASVGIPVTLWTKHSDDGKPLHRKRPQRIRMRLDTAGTAGGLSVHLDGSTTQAANLSPSSNGEGVFDADLSTLSAAIQLGLRITGTLTVFKLYDWELEYLENPALSWGRVAATNLGTVAEKVISGVQFRVCTLGTARAFTLYLDNVAQPTFSLNSNINEPVDYTYQFTAVKTVKEVAWKVDGNVELYSWNPHLLYTYPAPRQIWDTGPIDLATDSLVWIRQARFKARTAGASWELTVTPYFDGIAKTPKVVSANPTGPSHYTIVFPRGLKGRQARFLIDAGASQELLPYWLEVELHGSGQETQKKIVRVTAQ